MTEDTEAGIDPESPLEQTETGAAGLVTVAIGSSAGGVEALRDLFDALPGNLGVAYVLVAHLDPTHPSELAAILSRHTSMAVEEVREKTRLQPDHVYVIAPDREIIATDGNIETKPFAQPRGQRAPIDAFFRSLAEQHRDGFALILSGGGTDGALGVRAMKDAGGVIFVQEPEEAQFSQMPNNAIATGAADLVLPVAKMARKLAELIETRRRHGGTDAIADDKDSLLRILALVRSRTGHDFTTYKTPTIKRRLARRIELSGLNSAEEYLAFLAKHPEEVQALLNDMLITVTTFFRDPAAFASLAEHVIPELMARPGDAGPIRVWVAGCATGEEVYSLAILLLEAAADRRSHPEIQIFATDIDAGAIETARQGLYPTSIEAEVSEERLHQFFTREGNLYRIKRAVRDVVVFAYHSVLKDPPFSRIDLVSCRNLLIYLRRDTQRDVLASFRYALSSGGYLFLGSAETPDRGQGLFRTVDAKAHIYQALRRSTDHPVAAQTLPVIITPVPSPDRLASVTAVNNTEAALHRQVLEDLAPPSMLVDAAHQVVHLSDTAGRYLRMPGGTPSSNVMKIITPELKLDLHRCLRRAFEFEDASLTTPVAVQIDGAYRNVMLHVRPVVRDGTVNEALVVFNEGPVLEDIPDQAAGEGKASDAVTARLYQELEVAHEDLRTTRADYESTTEELRAANEELQSINEEYRSTSEELETSKEELQSMNEELQTLNKELALKVDKLSHANADMQNLIAATEGGTLFLDSDMRIMLFTPGASTYFNVTAQDVGRPITDFTHRLADAQLDEDARAVLRDLTPVEKEITTVGGENVLIRLRPYRTLDDHIDGVVITFIDVTRLHQAEGALQIADKNYRSLVTATSDVIFRMSPDWEELLEIYGEKFVFDGQAPKSDWLKTFVAEGDREELMSTVRAAIRDKRGFRIEHRVRRPDGSPAWSLSRAVPILDSKGNILEWFGAASDITEAREAAEQIAHGRRLETVGRLAGAIAHDFNNLITIIMANLELAEMRVVDETVKRLLERAAAAAELGAGFNQRLLSLAGKRMLAPQQVAINTHVLEVSTLLEHSLGARIELRSDLAANLWPVFVDPGEVDNAFLNLALNARDALPEGGKITVKTSNITLEDADAAIIPDAGPGDYVCLEVSDNGHGMPEEIRAMASTPFFSTKQEDMGTGLGLFSVRAFVRGSGGFMSIDSQPDLGTTVRLYLPRVAEEAEPEILPGTDEKGLRFGQGELVLIVEDDAALRSVTCRRFEALGYITDEAGTADEAIEHLGQRDGIRAVFSDIFMPGRKTGIDLARWIRENRPDVRVALTTAYRGELDSLAQGKVPSDVKILAKPYTLAQLSEFLRKAMT